jgi:hypothetical protein
MKTMSDREVAVAVNILIKQLRWLLNEAEILSKETIQCVLIDFMNGYSKRVGEPAVPNQYPKSDA